MNKEAIIEGLLFVVGEDGLTLKAITEILEVEEDEAKELLKNLHNKYESEDRGIRLSYLGDSFKLTTKSEHKEYYKKLIENPESNVLSQAALEVLAIVAYNAPITRITVDEIRGVSSSQMMRKLVAKGLIKEVGKSDQPGRPILYATTSEFLDYFGLSTIEDLPEVKELTVKEISDDEVDLYTSKYKENIEEND